MVRATTIANLHRAGYTGHLQVKLRPDNQAPEDHDGWKARTRARIVNRGYRIINKGKNAVERAGQLKDVVTEPLKALLKKDLELLVKAASPSAV